MWSITVHGLNDATRDAAIDAAVVMPAKLLADEQIQVDAAKAGLKSTLAGMFPGAAFTASCTGSSWNGGGEFNFSLKALSPAQVTAMEAAGIPVPIDKTPIAKLG